MTSKQRAYLMSLAVNIPAKYQIGKNGIDYNFLDLIRDALEANELIKINVLENSLADPKTLCYQLCETVDAEPVKVIGNKIIIYKESKNKKKIVLPKINKK